MTDDQAAAVTRAERLLRQAEGLKSALASHAATVRRATQDAKVREEAAAILGHVETLRADAYQLWSRLLIDEHEGTTASAPTPERPYAAVLERLSGDGFAKGAESVASAAHLAATESVLGFALPVQLKELLSFVGNGGFGPGLGILGTLGSRPVRASNPYTGGAEVLYFDIVDAYRQHLAWPSRITPEMLGREPGTLEWFEPYDAPWPSGVLLLCDLGGGNSVYIRAQTGEILYSPVGEPEPGSGFPVAIEPLATSLSEWLERWMDERRSA